MIGSARATSENWQYRLDELWMRSWPTLAYQQTPPFAKIGRLHRMEQIASSSFPPLLGCSSSASLPAARWRRPAQVTQVSGRPRHNKVQVRERQLQFGQRGVFCVGNAPFGPRVREISDTHDCCSFTADCHLLSGGVA